MAEDRKEKSPDTEAHWKVQSLKAGAVLNGRKAQSESAKTESIAWLKEKSPEIYETITREGTLTPSAKLGLLRRYESITLMQIEGLSREGLYALLPTLTGLLDPIDRAVKSTANAIGNEDMNITYIFPDNEEEKRIDDLILGVGK